MPISPVSDSACIPVGTLINNVNGLTILTSFTLIILQHYFTDFSKSFENIQKEYDKFKLSDLSDWVKNEVDGYITKNAEENGKAILIRAGIIDTLFVLLWAYAFMHMNINCKISSYWLLSSVLSIVSVLLFVLIVVAFIFLIFLRRAQTHIADTQEIMKLHMKNHNGDTN